MPKKVSECQSDMSTPQHPLHSKYSTVLNPGSCPAAYCSGATRRSALPLFVNVLTSINRVNAQSRRLESSIAVKFSDRFYEAMQALRWADRSRGAWFQSD
jgi:hypothetical protein